MKTEEDEAFDDLARKQGDWGGGYQAKRKMAADKQEPWNEDEWRRNNWRCGHGWLRGEQCEICNAAQPAQEPAAYVNDNGRIIQTGLALLPCTLLYTAPPKREWVGLTAEETSGFTQHEMTVVKYVSKVLQEKNT